MELDGWPTVRTALAVVIDPVMLPLTVILVAVIVPPTYKFPPIPTPPTTCNAPLLVEVAGVVLVNVKIPEYDPENDPALPT